MYCLPLIATAPILQIIFAGDRAKIAVAAQSVFFTTLVGVTLGLRSADPQLLDPGARQRGQRLAAQLVRVRLRSAIPGVFAGLKIAAPAAVLGAVIGEFLGGTRGIGVAMIASQQSFNVSRTWGLGVVLTSISAAAYLADRRHRAPRWPRGEPPTPPWPRSVRPATPARTWRRVAVSVVLPGGVGGHRAAGVDVGPASSFDLDPFFAKRPATCGTT